MKKILIILAFYFLTSNAFAINLSQALKEAYQNNPELNAERENIKAVSYTHLTLPTTEYV